MTQLITIDGEDYEVCALSPSVDTVGPSTHVCFLRKVEKPACGHRFCSLDACNVESFQKQCMEALKPAPKESKELWRAYLGQNYDDRMELVTSQCFADYILARVREELPEMMEEREKDGK